LGGNPAGEKRRTSVRGEVQKGISYYREYNHQKGAGVKEKD